MLRRWEELPEFMRTDAVRPYYKALEKKRYSLYLKRLFDFSMSSVMLILLSPVLLGLGIWIRMDSEGPVFYRQKRITQYGRPFEIYKFRTMVVNADQIGSQVTVGKDPRITRAGSFLRGCRLDELPQLINVLKGEMSLVGPRPIVRKEVPRYEKFIKEYYSVLPGITGVWQVSGRSDIDYPERVRMDSWYVHNWSIWLDIVMLWRTVSVVLRRKGAY